MTKADAQALAGIGDSIAEKVTQGVTCQTNKKQIEEIRNTGKLKKAQQLVNDEQTRVMGIFQGIWGNNGMLL